MSHRSRNLTRQIRANDHRRRARANIGETKPSGQGYPGPGATNAYQCPTCDGLTVTVHRAAGITPPTIRCQATVACKGRARSGQYAIPADQLPAPTHEWHRPDDADLGAGVRVHLVAGMLALRPIR